MYKPAARNISMTSFNIIKEWNAKMSHIQNTRNVSNGLIKVMVPMKRNGKRLLNEANSRAAVAAMAGSIETSTIVRTVESVPSELSILWVNLTPSRYQKP